MRFPVIFNPTLLALFLSIFSALQVWAASPENQVVLDIASSPENPRNSEGSFITLKSGQILFLYTQFHGGARDESPASIAAISSDDQGRTWNSTPQVVVAPGTNQNVMSVSLLRLKSGKIALFYLIKNSLLDCHPWMQLSSDEAKTWSDPKLVVPAPGYFVLNNDRVIQLTSGRLVLPVAFHRARNSLPHDFNATWDSRAITLWYLSDDEGATWRESDSWWAIPVASKTGLQEPGIVELANGNLLGWARTDAGAQFSFTSTNSGTSWSAPLASELKSPASPASIKKIPGSSDLLAVYNDHSGRFAFAPQKRTPLAAAISSDNGQTWPMRKVLEGDPKGAYCYTAIHFTEDAVLLAYFDFRTLHGGRNGNTLRIRRVNLDWLRKN